MTPDTVSGVHSETCKGIWHPSIMKLLLLLYPFWHYSLVPSMSLFMPEFILHILLFHLVAEGYGFWSGMLLYECVPFIWCDIPKLIQW
jgi:hypothetical protein